MPVEFELFAAGSCSHPEVMVIEGGSFAPCRFPALCGLIRHPQAAPILFDTGYSEHFHRETRGFPNSLYALMTPVTFAPHESAVNQLRRRGIAPEEVRYIIVSHFHADHIGGSLDFPNARFIFLESGYQRVGHLRGFDALRRGFLPGLLPGDFAARALPLESLTRRDLPQAFQPFEGGTDLFGDGSVVAVELPGHAAGQLGVFLDTAPQPTFFIADACWSSRAFRELKLPHPLAFLIMDDRKDYVETLGRIHQLHHANPGCVRIVPSHCAEVWDTLVAR